MVVYRVCHSNDISSYCVTIGPGEEEESSSDTTTNKQ